MSYFTALGLNKEPFSTSPDPGFFYRSASHNTALKRLEIAIRLRRGLSVVFGDIGTGKTTLSRALIQSFKNEPDFLFHMVLDPGFKSEFQFLNSLVQMFAITPDIKSALDFKEALQKYLFQKGVEENKVIVLLIDEGQKLSFENLEALRTLLNFETNEYKLLQVVILSQVELIPRIKRVRNFFDRVALKYTLNPLDETETREMIEFRLKQAGLRGPQGLFNQEAIRAIYQYTQGYPRKIALLCHDCLEEMVMHETSVIDMGMVEGLIKNQEAYS